MRIKNIIITAASLLALSVTSSAFAGAPKEPRVVDFKALEKTIGRTGGTLNMLMSKPKDIRMMVIYSGARLVTYDNTFTDRKSVV